MWISRNCPTISNWNDVIWVSKLHLFIVVSDANVMTSGDGIIWKDEQIEKGDWTSITWSNELSLLVIVGNSKYVATSKDGVNWKINNINTDNLKSVIWIKELHIFIAVGNNGNIIVSNDSISWDKIETDIIDNLSDIVWSKELKLIVSISSSGINNRVITSNDSITWKSQKCICNYWSSIEWSPKLNLFVAVSKSGLGNRVMTSNNGKEWIQRNSANNNNWESVVWSKELSKFIAVSSTGNNNRIMESSDGIIWKLTSHTPNNNYTSICWSPELSIFVIVSNSGTRNRILTSKIHLPNTKNSILISPAYFTTNSDGSILSLLNDIPSTDSKTGTLLVSGGISISNTTDAIDYKNGGSFTTDGGMSINKNVFIGESLNVNKNINIDGSLKVNNNFILNGGLNILSENGDSFSTTGGVSISKNLYIGNNIDIGNNCNIKGDITVNKLSSLNLLTTKEINVIKNINIGDSLNVKNNIISNKIDVLDSINVFCDLNVNKNTIIHGSISIKGDTILNNLSTNKLTINNDLIVLFNTKLSGETTIEKNLIINKNLNVNEDLIVNGNTTITGILNIDSDLILSKLIVGNTIECENSITCNNIYNKGVMSIDGNLIVKGLLTNVNNINAEYININKELVINEIFSIGKELNYNGDSYLKGNLLVDGLLNINNSASFNKNININGNLILNNGKIIIDKMVLDINRLINNKLDMLNTMFDFEIVYTTDSVFKCILWVEELNKLIALSKNKIFYSTSGINWTQNIIEEKEWVRVCWSPKLKLLLGISKTGNIISSNDSITWIKRFDNFNYSFTDIIWYNNCFYIIGNVILRSLNGITFTLIKEQIQLNSITCSNELLIVVGDQYMLTSINGKDFIDNKIEENGRIVIWSNELQLILIITDTNILILNETDLSNKRVIDIEYKIKNIIWCKELNIFIAINIKNNIIISNDGIIWKTIYNLNTSVDIYLEWSKELSRIIITSDNSILLSNIVLPSSKSTLLISPEHLYNDNGNLTLSKNLDIKESINIGKNLIINGNINCNLNTIVNGDLNVTGISNLYNTNISGHLNITGDLNVENLTCIGELLVEKDLFINTDIIIKGQFINTNTNNNSIVLSGGIICNLLKSNIINSKNNYIENDLFVSGITTINSLIIKNNTKINSNSDVSLITNGGIKVSKNINVDGDIISSNNIITKIIYDKIELDFPVSISHTNDIIFRYNVHVINGNYIIQLPEYFDKIINTDTIQIFITPKDHFGSAYGKYTDNNVITIYANNDSEYYIMIIGIKK